MKTKKYEYRTGGGDLMHYRGPNMKSNPIKYRREGHRANLERLIVRKTGIQQRLLIGQNEGQIGRENLKRL